MFGANAVIGVLAFLLAAQATPAPAPTPSGRDVVVQALRKLRLATDLKDGKVASCQVRVSSGDAAIDAEACAATTACVTAGYDQSEPLANCVDQSLSAFVRTRSGEDRSSSN